MVESREREAANSCSQHRPAETGTHERREEMSDENSEEVTLLEAEVQRLQAEIKALQQQQDVSKDVTVQSRGRMQDALRFLCGRSRDLEETVVSRLKEEVEELEEDLKLQTQWNGVSVNSCITRTLQSRDQERVQLCRLSARCSQVEFQVEFQLSEVKDDSRTERRISDLNLVLDFSDLQSLSSFLSRMEETRDLLLFLRTIRTFSERCDDRTRTFQHFQVSEDPVSPEPDAAARMELHLICYP
ncbi:centromere protein P [Fundulus heteroclitus]|uniref:centromere protein P n=1 Tax=Fundulus heteroclitus TaxID=8078 RepID=UPI00165CCC08|nr:centromere protein P [Fundulus heteroclitus]